MNVKIPIAVVVFILLLLSGFTGILTGSYIVVSEGDGGDFTSIQEAIDNAVVGDTIFIEPGIYNLNNEINITKSLNIIANGSVIINGPGQMIVKPSIFLRTM